MGAYEYKTLDTQGKTKKGILHADTVKQARQLLRDQGLTPLDVAPITQQKLSSKNFFNFNNRVSTNELAITTQQLATLLSAGLPIEEVLDASTEYTSSNNMKKVLMSLRSALLEGQSLATGIKQFPNIFPPIYVSIIEAGEQSGKLANVLSRLASYITTKQNIMQKTMLALIYPVLLLIVSVGIVIGLLSYVVPQITIVFENVNQQLPILTQWLIISSDFLTKHYFLLLLIVPFIIILLVYSFKFSPFKERLQQLYIHLPLLGRLSILNQATQFTRTMGILINSGVSMVESLNIAVAVINNQHIFKKVSSSIESIREGTALSVALNSCNVFPKTVIRLIASGERSGKLDEMLNHCADTLESELNNKIASLTSLLGPLLILAVGMLVLLIVLAILLPIFQLNQLVI